MICKLCGMKMSKNLCEFCEYITIHAPLISINDIEFFTKKNAGASVKVSVGSKIENFEIEEDILVKYLGDSDIVTIPSNVRIISEHCFLNSHVVRVKIPSSVEIIGSEQLGDYVNNNGAFEFCKELEVICFDDGSRLQSIERYAFNGCRNLKKIVGLPSKISNVKSHAFCDCTLDASTKEQIVMSTTKKGLARDWAE